MIPRLHGRTHTPHDPLGEALGRPVSPSEAVPEHTVVAHWPGLDQFALDDEQTTWTSFQWAEHLEEALLEHPFAAGPDDDRRAILHLSLRLHPDDRDLTRPQWAEIAHRLARVVGIELPGKESGCRWIAVQARPGRLDLIANLIHLDGTWHAPPANTLQRLVQEARRIEGDLRLVRVPSGSALDQRDQLADMIVEFVEEQIAPVAAARELVEHTLQQIALRPGPESAEKALRLELIAQRLHHIQQDLASTAARGRPRAVPAPAAARHPTTPRSP